MIGRFSFFAAALLAGSCSGAAAADMIAKAPPRPAAAPSWSGPYVGLSLGARALEADWTTRSFTSSGGIVFLPGVNPITGTTPDAAPGYDNTAFRVGGYLGYNWQFAPSWLAGIEADAGWAQNKKTNSRIPGTYSSATPLTVTITANDTSTVDADWDGSVRGRLGYLVTPSLLVFGTGGVAFQHVDLSAVCIGGAPPNFVTCVGTHASSTSKTLVGWTVGGGLEGRLTGNWLARAEYRYADFGNSDFDLFTPATPLGGGGRLSLQGTLGVQTHTASVGIAYQFGR
jgi:outer membrane immunogenic protein